MSNEKVAYPELKLTLQSAVDGSSYMATVPGGRLFMGVNGTIIKCYSVFSLDGKIQLVYDSTGGLGLLTANDSIDEQREFYLQVWFKNKNIYFEGGIRTKSREMLIDMVDFSASETINGLVIYDKDGCLRLRAEVSDCALIVGSDSWVDPEWEIVPRPMRRDEWMFLSPRVWRDKAAAPQLARITNDLVKQIKPVRKVFWPTDSV